MSKKQLTEYVNKQAIREVLGCFLQQPTLLREYKTSPADFPETFHKLIFAAINNLYKNGAETIDAVAIDEYLSHYETQYQAFQKNQGIEFLLNIQQLALTTNVKYYYEQLKKFSLLRRYVEYGIDVSDYFDPNEIEPVTIESQRKLLDNDSIQDIVNHFKKKHLEVTAPFILSEGRDSKKAGTGGHEQKELWKKDTAWGIGYSSAYLTTIFHGLRKRKFIVKSAGSGIGKTRTSIADICYSCAPYYYDKKLKSWMKNPNGTHNGALYIGTEMELLEEIDPILWAYMADVPQDHIEFNMYEDGEEERVDEAIRILEEEGNIWLEYVPQYDISMLEDVIEEHKIKHNIEYVWFDYIHATVELISEFASKSKAKMTTREDQVLASLSTDLKAMARKYNISLESCTQVTTDAKDDSNRDQSIVAGAKAILNKADGGLIAMPPSTKEMKKIESILREMLNKPSPNLVYSIYKNRGGKYTKIKVWLYIDYGTMRTHDLFVTDYDYHLITDIEKTYIDIDENEFVTNQPIKIPVDKIEYTKKSEELEF